MPQLEGTPAENGLVVTALAQNLKLEHSEQL